MCVTVYTHIVMWRWKIEDARTSSKVIWASSYDKMAVFRDLLDLLRRGLVLLPGGRDLRGAPTMYFPASSYRWTLTLMIKANMCRFHGVLHARYNLWINLFGHFLNIHQQCFRWDKDLRLESSLDKKRHLPFLLLADHEQDLCNGSNFDCFKILLKDCEQHKNIYFQARCQPAGLCHSSHLPSSAAKVGQASPAFILGWDCRSKACYLHKIDNFHLGYILLGFWLVLALKKETWNI